MYSIGCARPTAEGSGALTSGEVVGRDPVGTWPTTERIGPPSACQCPTPG